MPNNGTRIYTENGKGIDLRADVYKVLGITRRRNGYDLGYACTNTHGKINPDSLYKPFAVSNYNRIEDWEYYRYGYEIPMFNLFETKNLPDTLLSEMRKASWVHTPLGAKDWKVLGHFNGYNHSVRYEDAPWGIPVVDWVTWYSIQATVYMPNADGLVHPDSMRCLDEYPYLAAAVYKRTTTGYHKLVWLQCEPRTEERLFINIDMEEDGTPNIEPESTYIIIPFLTRDKFKAGSYGDMEGLPTTLKECLWIGYHANTVIKEVTTPKKEEVEDDIFVFSARTYRSGNYLDYEFKILKFGGFPTTASADGVFFRIYAEGMAGYLEDEYYPKLSGIQTISGGGRLYGISGTGTVHLLLSATNAYPKTCEFVDDGQWHYYD